MKVIPMQTILVAAKAAGATVGHDGAAAHLDVSDLFPVEEECVCESFLGYRQADCPVCQGVPGG